MTILALDLATTTGWAIYQEDKINKVFSGTESFKNDRYSGGGMRFLKFEKFLEMINFLVSDPPTKNIGPPDFQRTNIKEVVFEEVRRHIGVDAAHVYGGFMGVLTSWCEKRKIPYQGVPAGTIKKFITGKGNASKIEVINAIKEKGHTPQDDNEADALALLYWRLENEKNIP